MTAEQQQVLRSLALVTVKGIPVFWKAALFAGRRSERRPRSVRGSTHRFLRCRPARRRQRMPEGRRGGERVGMRHQAPAPGHELTLLLGRPVLHSVLRPVRVDPHGLPRRKPRQVGRSRRHRGWASSREREQPAPGSSRADECAARRVPPLPQGRGRGTSDKARRSWPPSLRGSRARVWLPARRVQFAEIDRRRRVSNTLGKRAPKRAVRAE